MSQSLDDIRKSWEERTLKVHPERKTNFESASGIPIERLYVPSEDALDYLDEVGFPGEFPFTRGIHPTMYRGRIWTMRQYAGYATAEETNHRFRYLLDQGQTGLSVAFDLPTQLGYDADDSHALGEVGKVGVSISCLDDMVRLFDQIPLDRVSTSMTINAPAAILLAMYLAIAKRQGVAPQDLRGTIQNDILKEYVARGTYIFPPSPAMRLTTDILRYCQSHVPQWNTISISGYHIREAGSTAVQEIAFTMANAIAYVQTAVDAGLAVDEFAPRLTFFFNAHNDFLEEVAKFRAARRLWARIMRERFGAKNPKSMHLRFHTQTAGSTLTAQQPYNNIVRVTFQALAAVLGGTQSLHTNSMDEALGLPTEHAVQVALRTQQILAHESGAPHTIDPLAGSFLIEHLTNEIEILAMAYLEKIDEMGGVLVAIEEGYVQREIQDAAYKHQQGIDKGEVLVVGVNACQMDEAQSIRPLEVDPEVERAQSERLAHIREHRDPQLAVDALNRLTQAVDSGDNLMPIFISCVEADLTLGEICGRLRQIWGEYQPPVSI